MQQDDSETKSISTNHNKEMQSSSSSPELCQQGASINSHQFVDASTTTSSSCFLSFSFYIRSFEFIELILCFVFAAITNVVPLFVVPLNKRSIPYLYTESGDIILDLIHDEELVKETISDTVLIVTCVVGTLILQLLTGLIVHGAGSMDAHKTLCVYSIAFGLNSLLTEAIKNYVGYLRPNFYDLCQTDWDGVVDGGIPACANVDMSNGYKSFPSGHAGTAFTGCTLYTLYLLGNFGINRHRGRYVEEIRRISNCSDAAESAIPTEDRVDEAYRDGEIVTIVLRCQDVPKTTHMIRRIYSILSLLPMAYAFFVAVSRVRDNFHFPADVMVGSAIGFLCSTFAHGLWFPSFPLL